MAEDSAEDKRKSRQKKCGLSDNSADCSNPNSVFQISRCRVVDQFSAFGEAGAVTWAVPGVFYRISFRRAAQMRTALGGGRQQVDHSPKDVDSQLGMEREGENTFAYGFFFLCTRSLRSIADTMEVVIPHLLNPVATYRF